MLCVIQRMELESQKPLRKIYQVYGLGVLMMSIDWFMQYKKDQLIIIACRYHYE